MCSRVECPQCHRPTFAGCGAHVEQVLGNVPKADRCHCREDAKAKTAVTPDTEKRSWLRDLWAKYLTNLFAVRNRARYE